MISFCVSESSAHFCFETAECSEGRHLVPAGEVVVLGDLVEAERQVHHRHRELGGVDGAELQRLEDFAGLQDLRLDAELLHDVGAQAEEAHLQTLEVVDGLDLLAEPAGGLGRDHAAEDGSTLYLRVQLLHELLAAAVAHPAQVLADLRAERHGRVHRESDVLAGEEAEARPGRVERAVGDASKYWLAGTSAPGSKKRMSIEPPDIFLTFSTK